MHVLLVEHDLQVRLRKLVEGLLVDLEIVQ